MVSAVAILLIGFGVVYFAVTMYLGRRYIRRLGVPGDEVVPEPDLDVYFLVACLNEEPVIGETVRRLAANRRARIVVIDDGSDDGTAECARRAGGRQALIVRRHLPAARQGKGMALNSGFRRLVHDVRRRGLDPDRVLVCVMDADGHLSPNTLGHVGKLFTDPDVGGVQLAVRIRNREHLITEMQDLEFWGLSATSQFGRVNAGTVSLGGNGQFTRLSALLGLGHPPWSESLTEDLDLALTLLADGWKLTTTPHAWVDQQGVETLTRLARQRTRWMQGHMTCGARIGEIWRSAHVPNLAAVEVTLYLLVPWVLVLPWSIVFHIGVAQLVALIATGGGDALFGDSLSSRLLFGAAWYVLSFLPNIVCGYLYYRRDPSVGFGRAVLLGHLLIPYNYVAYFSCWRALGRIILRRRGWDKTARVAEGSPSVPGVDEPTLQGVPG